MNPIYVIAEQDTGRVYTGHRIVRNIYTGEKMNTWMVEYPNKKKPVLFRNKEEAKERLETLNKYFYIRRAKGRELKWMLEGK